MTLPTSGLLPSGLTPAILNPAGLFVGGAGSSGGSPALFTLRTSLTEGSGGYRGVTHPANDSADYTRLVPDHEGVWRGVKQNASRHYGARVVENLAPASEDLTSAAWTVADSAINSVETATTIELTETDNSYHYKTIDPPSGDTTGRTFVVSADVTWISGATSIGVRSYNSGGAADDSVVIDLSDLSTKRITLNVTHDADGAVKVGIDNRSAVISGVDTGVTKVTFTNIQIEEATGRLDTTTPSEYVSTGVATGEELVANTTLTTNADEWTSVNSPVITHGASGVNIQNDGVSYGLIYQAISTVVGATYIASADIVFGGIGRARFGWGNAVPTAPYTTFADTTTSGTYSGTFVATATTAYISVGNRNDEDAASDFTNITVKRIDLGNNVDGQKSFASERNALAISNTVQEFTANGDNAGYVDLDGTGDYVSTPDSVANSITGDIDIRALIQLDDWTPAAETYILGKWATNNVSESYILAITSSSTLKLIWTTDGSTDISKVSTAAISQADGNNLHIRATLDVDNGASGYDVKFYTSVDGVTWTQLGLTVTTAGTTSIYDSVSAVEVGSILGGTLSRLAGKIYRAQIFNEIDGTVPVVDFNPGKDSNENDTSFTSSTGEVWTTQGDASLHKKGLPLGRNLISNNGLANDTLIGTGGNFQDNLGDELVTNGGFATDTDWTKGTGWTISGNTASCDGTQTGNSFLSQLIGVIAPNTTYLTTYTISNYSAGGVQILPGGQLVATERSADGTYSEVVTTPSNANSFMYMLADADFIGDIDNVSVKEVTEGSTGWTANDSEAIIIEADGNLRVINGDASQSAMQFTISTVVGKTYTLFIDNSASGGALTYAQIGTTPFAFNLLNKLLSFSTVNKATFTATTSTTYVTISPSSTTSGHYSEIKGIYITPGIPLSGLMMEGSATNLITQPRDMTNAAWTETGTSVAALDAVGIDGQPNSASTLTDDDGAAYEYVDETVTVTADTNEVFFSAYVKKDADVSRFVGVLVDLKTGGTATQDTIHLNTSTGAIVTANPIGAGSSSAGVIDRGLWWEVYATLTNTNNTAALLRLYPSISTTIGTRVVTATGSAIFDAVSIQENTSYPTSPILATGGATRTSDTGYTLDVNNWPDATGSLELEVTPLFYNVAFPSNRGLIAPSNGILPGFYFHANGVDLNFRDGTTTVIGNNAWDVAQQTIKQKAVWSSSSSTFSQSTDGTSHGVAAFDGSFEPSGAIYLAQGIIQGITIKNLKIYRQDKGSAWLASS